MKTRLFTLISIALASLLSAATVSWNASPTTEQVTEYRVYEKTGPPATPVFTKIATVAAPAVAFTLVNPAPNVAHTYVVRAFNLAGESPNSNEVTLPALPAAPVGVKLTIEFTIPGQ